MERNNNASVNLEVNGSFQASNQGSRQNSARMRKPKKNVVFKEANVSSPGKPSKERPDARHRREAFQHQKSYEAREALLRQNSKITDDDISEYKKTEIIRKSIADVKKRAAAAEFIRKSPEKVYSHVKSRIAGNMKAQKKAKKTAKRIEMNIANTSALKSGDTAKLHEYRPYSASPSKKSKKSFIGASPERLHMI